MMIRSLRALVAIVATLLAALLGLAALAVAAVAVMDWNRFRDPLAERASVLVGRPLTIAGDLDLDLLTLTPALVAHDVRFANPEGASQPHMAEIGRLAFQVDLRALLGGRIRILGLHLADGVVTLEKDAEGRANWDFSPAEGAGAAAVEAATPQDRSEVPDIERLTFENLRIVYREPDVEPLEAVFASLTAESTAEGVALAAQGSWRGAAFALEGTLGSVAALQEAAEPYPVALSVTAGDTTARIEGTVADPLAFTGFDTAIDLTGPSLDQLTQILGLPLPPTPQYALEGRLTSEGSVWRLADFAGRLGASDLRGTVSVETAGEVPVVQADVASKRLDLADLAGLIGGEEVRGAATGEQAAPDPPPGALLPADPFDLSGLGAVAGDVRFAVQEFRGGGRILQDVKGHAVLERGRLRLDPVSLGLAGGTIAGTVTVDGGGETADLAAALRLRDIELKPLVGDLDPQLATWGTVQGRIDLRGRGGSAHAVAASLDGEALLYMGRGGIGNVLIEGIGLDVTEVIASLFSTDPDSPIHCMILPLQVQDGVVRGDPMLLEAAQDTVLGDGTLDLETGAMQVRLRVRPHDFSLFNAPTVITVEGTVGGDIGIDKTELVGQALKKLLMMPLSPFFTEDREGEDPCAPVRQKLGAE